MTGSAPWQDDFFTWSFGYLNELGFNKALDLWRLAHGDATHAALLNALNQDAQDIDWSQRKTGTAYGLSLIHEQPGEDPQVLTSQPTGIAGRPRRNSVDMDALQSSEASEQRRDFLQVIVAVRPFR